MTGNANMQKSWNHKDISGERFGRLVALHESPNNVRGKHTYWICKCDCGKTKSIDLNHLRRGLTRSCGCLSREVTRARCKAMVEDGKMCQHITHGLCGTPLYRTWTNMKTRCYNRNNRAYKWYGEKGVTICDEWLNDFSAFHRWALANGYSPDLTIDRIDPAKGYCPENCRWITLSEQRKTTRRYIEVHGVNS